MDFSLFIPNMIKIWGQYWEAWYADAQSISGIDQSYDDQGNAITG